MQYILQFAQILLWCENDFRQMPCTLPHSIQTLTFLLTSCVEAMHIADITEGPVSWLHTVHSIKQIPSINRGETTPALVVTVNGIKLCLPCCSSFTFQGLLQRIVQINASRFEISSSHIYYPVSLRTGPVG